MSLHELCNLLLMSAMQMLINLSVAYIHQMDVRGALGDLFTTQLTSLLP